MRSSSALPPQQLPPLRALQAFEAVARSGSVMAAAQEMGVSPGAVSQQVRKLEELLDLRLFEPGPLGLREQLLNRPLVQRFELDAARQLLHIDFSGLQVNASATIVAIESAVRGLLAPFGERVDVVVNYDHFGIVPELVEAYADMVHRLTADLYKRVTRYGTTGFVKSRLKPSPGD